MILQCPGCGTRFLVNDALIPASGREVKCAKCAHQWHVLPDIRPQAEPQAFGERLGDEAEPAQSVDALPNLPEYEPSADDDMPYKSRMPVVAEPAKPPVGVWLGVVGVLALLLAVAALFAFRSSLQQTIPGVYALLGQPVTEGLVLADVQLRVRPLRNKSRYIVEGHILNEAAVARTLPTLRIRLADKDGKWVVSREYEADKELAPGESFPFKAANIETSFVDRVDHVLVELGSGIELKLRK